ncbi:MAG: hypothetical protein Q8S31_07895 [Alphaproteobacteria bacterium]|nr:hypothetical protein [Alphaproteobacteria bacterium]
MNDFLADTIYKEGAADLLIEEHKDTTIIKNIQILYRYTTDKYTPISGNIFFPLFHSIIIFSKMIKNPNDLKQISNTLAKGTYNVQDLFWMLLSVAIQPDSNTNAPKILYIPALQHTIITVQLIDQVRKLAEGKNWTLNHYEHVLMALNKSEPKKRKIIVETLKKLLQNKYFNYKSYLHIINELSEMETYSENSLKNMLELTENNEHSLFDYLSLLHLSTFISMNNQQATNILKLLSNYAFNIRKSIFLRILNLSKGQNWSTEMYIQTIESFCSIPKDWHERAYKAINKWPLKNKLTSIGYSNLLHILSFFENEMNEPNIKNANLLLINISKLNQKQANLIFDTIKMHGSQSNYKDIDYNNIFNFLNNIFNKLKNNGLNFEKLINCLKNYQIIKIIKNDRLDIFFTEYFFKNTDLNNLTDFFISTNGQTPNFVKAALKTIDDICNENYLDRNNFLENLTQFKIKSLSELYYVDIALNDVHYSFNEKKSPKAVYYAKILTQTMKKNRGKNFEGTGQNFMDKILTSSKIECLNPDLDISFFRYIDLEYQTELPKIKSIIDSIINLDRNNPNLCIFILNFLNTHIHTPHYASEILYCIKEMSKLTHEEALLIKKKLKKGLLFIKNNDIKKEIFDLFHLYKNYSNFSNHNNNESIRYDSLSVFIATLSDELKFKNKSTHIKKYFFNGLINIFKNINITMKDADNFANHLNNFETNLFKPIFTSSNYNNYSTGTECPEKYYVDQKEKINTFLFKTIEFYAWLAKNYKNRSAYCLELFDNFYSKYKIAYRARNLMDQRFNTPETPFTLEPCKAFIRDIIGTSEVEFSSPLTCDKEKAKKILKKQNNNIINNNYEYIKDDNFVETNLKPNDFLDSAIDVAAWKNCFSRTAFSNPSLQEFLLLKPNPNNNNRIIELLNLLMYQWRNIYGAKDIY